MSTSVLEMIETLETYEIEASASPRKPNVDIRLRSSYSFNFDVANRAQTTGMSPRSMPEPLSLKEFQDNHCERNIVLAKHNSTIM